MLSPTCRTMLGLAGLVCLGILVSVVHGATTIYVQAKSAQLRDGKTSLSNAVATVQFGEEIDVLRQEEDWLQVRTSGGAMGWIFANKTTPTKPSAAGSDSGLAKLGQAVRQAEAAPVTASVGARGLDKVSEEYAKRSGIPKQYQNTVDRMTANRLSDEEVEAFLKEGRLGEYAK